MKDFGYRKITYHRPEAEEIYASSARYRITFIQRKEGKTVVLEELINSPGKFQIAASSDLDLENTVRNRGNPTEYTTLSTILNEFGYEFIGSNA